MVVEINPELEEELRQLAVSFMLKEPLDALGHAIKLLKAVKITVDGDCDIMIVPALSVHDVTRLGCKQFNVWP